MSERPEDDLDPTVQEQEEAAAREAARIGGPDPQPGVDPADRPVIEGGEGYAEGFEQAERDLEANATHESRGADPLRDAGAVEESDPGTEYGEADHAGAQGQQPSSQGDHPDEQDEPDAAGEVRE